MFWNRGVLSFGNWVGSLRWEYKPRHSFAMGVIVWILKLLLKASSQQRHVRVWSSSESLTKHLVATNSLLLMAPSSSHALSSVKTKTDAYYSIHYSDTNDISKFSPMVSSSTRKILVVPNTVLESDYLCKNSAPSTCTPSPSSSSSSSSLRSPTCNAIGAENFFFSLCCSRHQSCCCLCTDEMKKQEQVCCPTHGAVTEYIFSFSLSWVPEIDRKWD